MSFSRRNRHHKHPNSYYNRGQHNNYYKMKNNAIASAHKGIIIITVLVFAYKYVCHFTPIPN